MMQYDNAVDTSCFTTNVAVGGNGGNPFHWNYLEQNVAAGTLVRSIQFWNDKHCIRGVHVVLTDGNDKGCFGTTDGLTQSDVFYFADGETITSLKFWANNFHGGRLSAVEWTTSDNRSFGFGPRSGDPTYEPEVGSGFFFGLFGRSDLDIDCLGFTLLRRIEKAKLINLDYPNIQTAQINIAPESIKTITYDNSDGSADQTFTFAGTETVMQSSSWSMTTGIEVGVAVEVQGGIPLIASVKTTVSTTISVSGTYGQTNTSTTEESFSFPITVPAGKKITATATLYEGNIDTEYTATMEYRLDSGKVISFNTNGTYKGVDSDKVVVTLEED